MRTNGGDPRTRGAMPEDTIPLRPFRDNRVNVMIARSITQRVTERSGAQRGVNASDVMKHNGLMNDERP